MKPNGQRSSKTKQRRQRIGFALELFMLHEGRSLVEVLWSACGQCNAGRVWVARWLALLDQLPTAQSRRMVLGHWLRWWSYDAQGKGPKKHGSQWRVTGASGFVGHQHELREPTETHVDDETGEVFERRGAPRLMHIAASSKHGYGRAGGMAAHEKRCPRQLARYRRHLRGASRETPRGASTPAGIVACEHPPYQARDAERPKAEGSKFAYGQAWLLLPPSPEMLSRWGGRPSSARPPRELASDRPRPHSDPYGLAGVVADVLGELER